MSISNDPNVIRCHLIEELTQWWEKQRRRAAGPINHGLFKRVQEALQQNQKEHIEYLQGDRTTAIQHADSNSVLIALANEVQGVQAGGVTSPPAPKGKPGRKGNVSLDEKIWREYTDGLESGEWDSQADYVRQKHPRKSKAWFSQLKKRLGVR